MKANCKIYTIKKMTELFGVSRSAYYKYLHHGVSRKREYADAKLLEYIKAIVEKHHRRYGSPRVKAALLHDYGIKASLKKVAQMMREHGLNARKRKKYVTTTDSKHSFEVNENILARQFFASESGLKWVSDITYLRTTGGWVYLTTVIDLYDRKVIGWSLSESLETSATTIPAFKMAVNNRRQKEGLIFHSDRGVQYCAESFRSIIHNLPTTVRQSMSGKGNCWDNACAESFFKTLKRELDTLNGKHSVQEVRQSVFMYIESYYNRIRLHSGLDFIAPNDYFLGNAA
jgi:transposase InsO family protein